MHDIQTDVTVPYTPHQIFTLVNDVAHYPAFLKWCGEASITPLTPTTLQATLGIHYCGLKHAFTTLNTIQPDQSIHMQLIKGPFEHLEGTWTFEAIPAGCHISFKLTYVFATALWKTLLSHVFQSIAETLVAAFIQEAQRRYGLPSLKQAGTDDT